MVFEKVRAVHASILSLSLEKRKNLSLIGFVMFILLFSYPMVRATTDSFLLTEFGAKSTPYGWIFSVGFLSASVGLINLWQTKHSVQFLFWTFSLISLFLFLLFFTLYKMTSIYWSYPIFILKEVYMVILVHLTLGYLNTSLKESEAKIIYGPLGAMGSIGGILGALFTSKIAGVKFNIWHLNINELLFLMGAFLVFGAALIFVKTDIQRIEIYKKKAPLQLLSNKKRYISLIALIVALSQFVINIGNFQFNHFVSETFSSSSEKAAYLGSIFVWINSLSLLIQILLMPLILKFIPHSITHIMIPSIYIFSFIYSALLSTSMAAMSFSFITFKGIDYSIFSAAKELLYYSLDEAQKYGAKYIVDMVIYRLSKGLISLILIVLPIGWLNTIMGLCLAFWLIALIPLFILYNRYQGRQKYESITV